jgi:hypothetical protein
VKRLGDVVRFIEPVVPEPEAGEHGFGVVFAFDQAGDHFLRRGGGEEFFGFIIPAAADDEEPVGGGDVVGKDIAREGGEVVGVGGGDGEFGHGGRE